MATTLTGERIEELKQQAADHFWPHNNPAGNMGDDGIKLVQSGKGVWVEDVEGEQWLTRWRACGSRISGTAVRK